MEDFLRLECERFHNDITVLCGCYTSSIANWQGKTFTGKFCGEEKCEGYLKVTLQMHYGNGAGVLYIEPVI